MTDREWYDEILERRINVLEAYRAKLELAWADERRIVPLIIEQKLHIDSWRETIEEEFSAQSRLPDITPAEWEQIAFLHPTAIGASMDEDKKVYLYAEKPERCAGVWAFQPGNCWRAETLDARFAASGIDWRESWTARTPAPPTGVMTAEHWATVSARLEVRWVAADISGEVYTYSSAPHRGYRVWLPDQGLAYRIPFLDEVFADVPWEASLEEKPR